MCVGLNVHGGMSFKSLCYSGTGAEFRGTVSLVNNSFDRIVVRFYLHSWLMEVLFKKLSSLSMRQWPIIAFQMFESLSESPHHNLTHTSTKLCILKKPQLLRWSVFQSWKTQQWSCSSPDHYMGCCSGPQFKVITPPYKQRAVWDWR